jgi:hypothetical protein
MQVLVTRWFVGQPISGIAAVEILLGDSAMCGMNPLPAGREYLFQTYPSETARHSLSGCSAQGDLSTPDGQALLARTVELYGAGAGAATATDAPTEAPAPAPTDAPTGAPAPEAPTDAPPAPEESYADPTPAGLAGSIVGTAVPVALIVAFALGLIAGLALILRRRGGDGA